MIAFVASARASHITAASIPAESLEALFPFVHLIDYAISLRSIPWPLLLT